MSHRVKNLLANAAGLTNMSARAHATSQAIAEELTGRLTALGRTHDLVRPLPGGQGEAALLGDLIAILLAPYDDLGAFKGRVRVAVERMGVGERAATALALVLHKLATISMKYGALSMATGTLDVSSTTHDNVICLTWIERGGLPIASRPAEAGFGSQLVDGSVTGQLGGSIHHDWSTGGLVVNLKIDRARLAA